jgi:hypothetical protein
MIRPNESRTSRISAVGPVLSLQFFFLTLKVTCQLMRHQNLHIAPGHDLPAASGRVDHFILQREPEEALETTSAVGMLAWCLPGTYR